MFLDIFYITVLIVISFMILVVLQKKFKFKMSLLMSSYIYHAFFAFFYCYIVQNSGGDAVRYYHAGLSNDPYFLENPVGTKFIETLAYLLVQPFDMGFYSISFLFSLFGFFGLLIFYITVKENIGKSKLFALILFIPGLNFWTSALGKDSLAFFSIALITYGFSRLDKRKALIIMGLTLLFFIRPHMAFLIVLIAGLVVIVSSKSVRLITKLFFTVGVLGFLVLAGPFVAEFVGIDSLSEESVGSYVEKKESYNTGGSGVNISEYNTLMKMLTYLFRPLFFDSSGLMGLVVSAENLFYVIIFSMMLNKKFFSYMARAPLFVKFNFFYSLSAWIILSAITPNLGIAIRQKTMFIVNLIVVVLLYLYARKQKKMKNRVKK